MKRIWWTGFALGLFGLCLDVSWKMGFRHGVALETGINDPLLAASNAVINQLKQKIDDEKPCPAAPLSLQVMSLAPVSQFQPAN